jgi:hypothetical protein
LCYLAGIGLQRIVDGSVTRLRLLASAAALGLAGTGIILSAYNSVIRSAPDADTPDHRTALVFGLLIYLAVLALAALVALRLQRSQATDSFLARSPIPNPQSPITFAAAALIAFDLMLVGANAEIEPNDPTAGYHHPVAVEFLRAQPGPTRIDAATGLWQPDAALMHGLEDIGGLSNPLALAHYDAYYWSVGHRGSPQYNFLGAQFVVAGKGVPPADSTFVPVFDADPAVDIYLNTNARPRVSLVPRAITAASAREAFDLVHAPGFDPAMMTVVEGGPPLAGSAAAGEASLSYVEYGAERIVVRALTPSPAYLVFSEVWYPGWRARVDGQAEPVYRANTAFRAVLLAPGEHEVALVFDPWTFKAGAAITALTLAGLAGWRWRRALRRLRQPVDPG